MAGNTESVNELVEQLRSKAYPCALKEYKKLTTFAHSYGHKGKLEPWDLTYFSERQKEDLFEFTQEELRPYFSLPDVLTGLFTLCEKLFNVHIVEVSKNDINNTNDSVQTWHEDVSFFQVLSKNNDNQHIASF